MFSTVIKQLCCRSPLGRVFGCSAFACLAASCTLIGNSVHVFNRTAFKTRSHSVATLIHLAGLRTLRISLLGHNRSAFANAKELSRQLLTPSVSFPLSNSAFYRAVANPSGTRFVAYTRSTRLTRPVSSQFGFL